MKGQQLKKKLKKQAAAAAAVAKALRQSAVKPIREIRRAKTVLECLVQNGRHELLSIEKLDALLQVKWQVLRWRVFGLRLLFTVAFLICFHMATITRSVLPSSRLLFRCSFSPADSAALSASELEDAYASCKSATICESLVAVFAGMKMLADLRRMWRMGWRAYVVESRGAMLLEHCISTLTWALLIIAYSLDAVYGRETSRQPFAFAAIVANSSLLWFLLGAEMTGPFVITLYKMMFGDVLRFLILLFILFLAFTQAFLMLSSPSTLGLSGGVGFAEILRLLFQKLINPDLMDPSLDSSYLAPMVFFTILVPIVLVNLLIASLGQTFQTVHQEANLQWKLERARIVLSLEEDVPSWLRLRWRYWTLHSGRPYFIFEEKNEQWASGPDEQRSNSEVMERVKQLPRKDAREKQEKERLEKEKQEKERQEKERLEKEKGQEGGETGGAAGEGGGAASSLRTSSGSIIKNSLRSLKTAAESMGGSSSKLQRRVVSFSVASGE